MNTRLFLAPTLCLLVLGLTAAAADWPQFRGPNRDDISTETGLLKTWPKGGPPLAWSFDKAGVGFSGFSVVGGKLFTMGNREGKEQVICVDAKTGKELWATDVDPAYDHEWGDGPRATPTIDGELLYTLTARGDLICLETAKGAKRWEKSLSKDLKGEMMSGWGFCESPLVDGDLLICCPGGPQGAIAALDKKTGETVWRTKELTDKAAYSSVVVAEIGGVKQYVFLTAKGIAGVAAKDGKLLWTHAENGFKVAVIPTPIIRDDYVYATASYGFGCDLVKLSADGSGAFKTEGVYGDNPRKVMENHHGGVVLIDGYIYGCSGNSNSRAKWVCQEFKTGAKVWESEKLDPGSITCADGLLYLYSQKDGTCVLIEASKEAWKEHGRFKIPHETTANRKKGKIWTHPVVADGRLYLRDNDLIYAYDVRANGKSE